MKNIVLSVIGVLIIIALSTAAPHSEADESSSKELHAAESELVEKSATSQAEENGYTSEFKLNLLPLPVKNAESVNLEKEGIPSKILSLYDGGQKKLVDISNPVSIIDTIREEDKYGNSGDMFDGISRSIVNGYEAFSNLLNTLIQKPKELARSISKGITAQLDVIGGKLVGL